jgi:hypothetical protein
MGQLSHGTVATVFLHPAEMLPLNSQSRFNATLAPGNLGTVRHLCKWAFGIERYPEGSLSPTCNRGTKRSELSISLRPNQRRHFANITYIVSAQFPESRG